ncbi:glycerophosphodiester phosphodiesterase family protein [Bifidobacterium goeldii]|uniref:glycerophosphodiester phosphodiesterase family protein n=1 Tax=Bifidobacterium goeldii TaxID=2306975 RepID=UPI0013DE62E1|nr:glycerophosphodiester phosphodiesterase family protein [Bifidobacterium goeldii]
MTLAAVVAAAVLVCDIVAGAHRLIGAVQAAVPHETPLVIAHRGDSRDPENSLRAIHDAGEIGADYAEIDVRLTSDGVPVVFHDRQTGRLDAGGRNLLVSRTPLSKLQRMRMRQKGIDYRVPTLRQALNEAHDAPSKLGLLLDIKTDDRHAHHVARAVINEIERDRNRMPAKLMVMSVSREAVVTFKRLRPQWKIGLCASGNPMLTGWVPAPVARAERGMFERRGNKRGGKRGDDTGMSGTIRGDMGVVHRYGVVGSTTLPADFVVMRSHDITANLWRAARRQHMPMFVGAVNDYREARTWIRRGASGFLGEDVANLRRASDRYALA